MKYSYGDRSSAYSVGRKSDTSVAVFLTQLQRLCALQDPLRGHCEAGSLTGAVHLSNDNAGVLRQAQWEQKSHVAHKRKGLLD